MKVSVSPATDDGGRKCVGREVWRVADVRRDIPWRLVGGASGLGFGRW